MSGNVQAPLRSVAVFGGGLVALSAAIGFARALPNAAVTLVLTPLDPAALADRLPAVPPSARAMLARLGLEFDSLMEAGAAPRAAERFLDWDGTGVEWFLAQGDGPPAIGAGAFHQHWLEARRRGSAARFDAYVPDLAIARAGRCPPLDGAVLRLDPGTAGPLWLDRLQASGVRLIRDAVRGHAPGSDRVTLASGTTIVADLFVDATGPAATIAGRDDRIDWAADLPVDRLLLLADAAAPSPLDTYRAGASGWRATWPLRRMTLHGLGHAAARTTESRARRIFGTGGEKAQLLAIRPGRQRIFWRGNVLTLGDAAAETGPLGWTGFGLALAHLDLALHLLPGRSLEPLLLAEYDRRAGLRADRLRDRLAALYRPATPRKGEFWHPIPAGSPALAETLRQFGRRGTIPHHEEDSATRADWIAMLLGLGHSPAQRDPIAMSADPAAIDAALAGLRARILAQADARPAYHDLPTGTQT